MKILINVYYGSHIVDSQRLNIKKEKGKTPVIVVDLKPEVTQKKTH